LTFVEVTVELIAIQPIHTQKKFAMKDNFITQITKNHYNAIIKYGFKSILSIIQTNCIIEKQKKFIKFK